MILFLGFVVANLVKRRAKKRLEPDPEGVDLDLGLETRALSRRDPITTYMEEARRYPLLDRDAEYTLAKEHRATGDVEAAKRLITANLRLVVKIAHEYKRAYPHLIDLVGEGNIGLVQSVSRYDPDRGARFSTYAAWWIRAYILKFILDNWRLVRIGTTQAQRKLFFRLKKEKAELVRLGVEPDHRALADRMDVSEDEVAEMELRMEGPDVSLDAPVARHEPEGPTRLEALPGPVNDRPDTLVEEQELRSKLQAKIAEFASRLKGREATLFADRWLTETPKTLQQVGDAHGISRERTRQLEKRLLDRLRAFLESELGSAVQIEPALPQASH